MTGRTGPSVMLTVRTGSSVMLLASGRGAGPGAGLPAQMSENISVLKVDIGVAGGGCALAERWVRLAPSGYVPNGAKKEGGKASDRLAALSATSW